MASKVRARASSKQVERMLRQAEALGCDVRGGGSRHFQIRAPGGRGIVILSGTPSDVRAHENARAQLRRVGVELAKLA